MRSPIRSGAWPACRCPGDASTRAKSTGRCSPGGCSDPRAPGGLLTDASSSESRDAPGPTTKLRPEQPRRSVRWTFGCETAPLLSVPQHSSDPAQRDDCHRHDCDHLPATRSSRRRWWQSGFPDRAAAAEAQRPYRTSRGGFGSAASQSRHRSRRTNELTVVHDPRSRLPTI